MKRLFLVMLSLLFVFATVGCSSSPTSSSDGKGGQEKAADGNKAVNKDEPIELTVAFPGTDGDKQGFNKVIGEFNKLYPNIKVKQIFIPNDGWGDYVSKLRTMVAGGNAPDVVRIAIEGFQTFLSADLIVPLNDYMKKYPDLVKYDDLHPKLQSAFENDGKIYGFTWDWNNIVIHINKDMLKEAGLPVPPPDWTVDDFLKYAKAMTTKDHFGFAIPKYYFGTEGWMYANGAGILNQDMTKGALDDPKAIQVIQLFHDMVYKYKVAPVPGGGNGNNTEMQNQMANGQVAMIAAGRWPELVYTKNNLKDKFVVQYLPKFGDKRQVVFGTGAFPVMKSSKHQEAAFQLSAFLSGPFSQENFLATSSIPTRKSVMEKVLPNDPMINNAKIYEESADTARVVQTPKQYPEIESVFNKYMSSIMSDETDVPTGMKKATEEINQILTNK